MGDPGTEEARPMRPDRLILTLALLTTAAAWAAKPAAPGPVNLAGTWAPKYWTLKLALFQEGNRVWGANAGKSHDHFFRGQWEGGRLVVVANRIDTVRKKCEPRGVMVVQSRGNVSQVGSVWLTAKGRRLKGPWTRASADAGETVPYPWKEELTYCGMLRTYELAFKSASNQLLGTDWPILAAVADLLKADASMKIQVAGHTDSTGDAAKNQSLSEQRAEAVKKALVEKYGADAARISTKGWGAEQPLQDNKTAEGRAANRRVELVLAR
jgi:outer membrane protein OmpA-like peptidoglycan-associated protein